MFKFGSFGVSHGIGNLQIGANWHIWKLHIPPKIIAFLWSVIMRNHGIGDVFAQAPAVRQLLSASSDCTNQTLPENSKSLHLLSGKRWQKCHRIHRKDLFPSGNWRYVISVNKKTSPVGSHNHLLNRQVRTHCKFNIKSQWWRSS